MQGGLKAGREGIRQFGADHSSPCLRRSRSAVACLPSVGDPADEQPAALYDADNSHGFAPGEAARAMPMPAEIMPGAKRRGNTDFSISLIK
jgi:hypothetical protein